jgi:hypothetical protein
MSTMKHRVLHNLRFSHFGIIEPAGPFNPEEVLSREELVHLIIKALDFRPVDSMP